MNLFIKFIIIFLIFSLSFQVLTAQTTLQVVTREIEQEYTFNKSDNLIIRAEKGVINMNRWTKNKVKVIIKIVVKNKNLEIAKKELGYIDWNSFHKNSVLQLYNNVNLPKNATLESIVRVEYIVWVPQGTNLYIRNNFGQVTLSDLDCKAKIDVQYCDLILKNVSGTVSVTGNVGDLSFTDVNASLNVTSKHCAIKIYNPDSNCNIVSSYGSIKANLNNNFNTLNISAERCDVSVSNKNCSEIGLNLETKYGTLNLLEACYIKNKELLLKTTSGTQPNIITIFNYQATVKSPSLLIKASYGNITLD